jgi:hypothetical protein
MEPGPGLAWGVEVGQAERAAEMGLEPELGWGAEVEQAERAWMQEQTQARPEAG